MFTSMMRIIVLLSFATNLYAEDSTSMLPALVEPAGRSEMLWSQSAIRLSANNQNPYFYTINKVCQPETKPQLMCALVSTETTNCAIQDIKINSNLITHPDHYDVALSGNVYTSTQLCSNKDMTVDCMVMCG